MKTKRMFLISVSVSIMSLYGNSFAAEPAPDRWHSLGLFGSTHGKIARKALKRIDKNLYPDMKLADNILSEGSVSERGHADMRRDNGGKVQEIWVSGNKKNSGGVIPNYTSFKFRDAYLAIGVICHLTQDQAVPAHAANIAHFFSEDFEEYADYAGKFGDIPLIDNSKRPYEYYQAMQNDTRSKLSSWVNPSTQKPFWEPSPNAPRFGEDATFGANGTYGGGKDTYAAWRDIPNDNEPSATSREMISMAPEITTDRLSAAVGYTQAVIESASKALPPLVKDLKLSANMITPGAPVEISFTALENRTRNVKYSITLAFKGGKAETLFTGNLQLDKPSPTVSNQNMGDTTGPQPELECLFRKDFRLRWNGLYYGKLAAEGSYTIEVSLIDEDGNAVPAAVNSDSARDNNTSIQFSVVNILPESPASVSFDGRNF